MFTVWAIGSVIVHIRTFFLMPYDAVPEDVTNYSIFRASFVGRFFCKTKVAESIKDDKNEKDDPEGSPQSDGGISWTASLKTFLFWQFLVSYNVLSVRVKSIQGWVYPWMEWERVIEMAYVYSP